MVPKILKNKVEKNVYWGKVLSTHGSWRTPQPASEPIRDATKEAPKSLKSARKAEEHRINFIVWCRHCKLEENNYFIEKVM